MSYAPSRLKCCIKLTWIPYLGVFVFLLICNLLTPYLVDDFQYLYSFQTGERIRSVLDIFPSLYAHTKLMNGRLVTHFLVQLFVIPPAWFFDIVNAGMFVAQLWLIARLSGAKGWKSALICLFSFFALWTFEPMFGQVNLWQDGAVNYLWSVVFGMMFLGIFVRPFLSEGAPYSKRKLYFLFAFAVGAYSETVSAAVIFMAAVLVVLDAVFSRKSLDKYLVGLILTAFLGYISIYLAPAQWANKYTGSGGILQSAKAAVRMYSEFRSLLIAFLVLMVYNLSAGTKPRVLLLACTLLAGSLLSNFMMVFASYYPSRSACGACVLLICSVCVLLTPMLDLKKQPLILSIALLSLLSGLGKVPAGALDIYGTYRRMHANELAIAEKKAAGETDLVLPVVESNTKYSGLYCLKYLDTQDPTTWPNANMADYYGVSSILGESSD